MEFISPPNHDWNRVKPAFCAPISRDLIWDPCFWHSRAVVVAWVFFRAHLHDRRLRHALAQWRVCIALPFAAAPYISNQQKLLCSPLLPRSLLVLAQWLPNNGLVQSGPAKIATRQQLARLEAIVSVGSRSWRSCRPLHIPDAFWRPIRIHLFSILICWPDFSQYYQAA